MVFNYYFLLKDTAENLCVAIVGHKLNLFKNVTQCYLPGPVVRRPISANPGLNFNLGFFFFFFFCSKAFSRIIFSILYSASNHQIVSKRNTTEFDLKLSYLNSNFALTPGYLEQPGPVFLFC